MKIKLLLIVPILISSVAFSAPALAKTQELGTCLIDSLNGKERKQLAKWMFFSIAAHPELKSFSSVTPDDAINNDKKTGKLITRLFVENCPSEANAAQRTDPLAVQKAFELVGQVAMQELMTNNEVMKAISNYAVYADQEKINSVLTK